MANKPLVPTRNGEATLLAAQRRVGLSMRVPLYVSGLLLGLVLLIQSVSAEERVRVELGVDGDPEHLIELLQSAGYEAKMGVEAADQDVEEAQGIWIGRQVPFSDVKEIVRLALSKYPHLRYYMFYGDFGDTPPPEWGNAVYVGGSKWAAKGARAVDTEDARILFAKVGSQEELVRLIESLRK